VANSNDLRNARTRAAAERVSAWGSSSRLGQHVKALPVLVRSMGIAQATAYLARQNETRPMAEDLAWWLAEGCPVGLLGRARSGGVAAFIKAFVKLDQRTAHAADEEGLRFAEALKLFHVAIFGDERADKKEGGHGS